MKVEVHHGRTLEDIFVFMETSFDVFHSFGKRERLGRLSKRSFTGNASCPDKILVVLFAPDCDRILTASSQGRKNAEVMIQ